MDTVPKSLDYPTIVGLLLKPKNTENTFCFVAQCPLSVPTRVNRAAYQPNRLTMWRSVRAPCLRASTAPPTSLADVLCGAVSALRSSARQPRRLFQGGR